MNIREITEQREFSYLSKYACFSYKSKGRLHPAEKDEIRTEFQRDRDRIIHCKSFRRLMHKTQVFLSPEDDHYRTRLTHTLEVSQIARTIAVGLGLNEDLVEAISLGHDLGHTPFGHCGERVLKKCFSEDFSHAAQSLRVVDQLEKNGQGLNLTFEVRDGIVNHSWDGTPATLEGRVVQYSDRIAYINHDIDDACRAGIMSEVQIPNEISGVLGNGKTPRITNMVSSIVNFSRDKDAVEMDPDTLSATEKLRDLLFELVYKNPIAKGEEAKCSVMLESLFDFFVSKPDALPISYIAQIESGEDVKRAVADYISSMTDRYAIMLYKNIFIPKMWGENSHSEDYLIQ